MWKFEFRNSQIREGVGNLGLSNSELIRTAELSSYWFVHNAGVHVLYCLSHVIIYDEVLY